MQPQDLVSLFDRLYSSLSNQFGSLSNQFGSLDVTLNALLAKDKTIVLSSATDEGKTELLNMLHLQEIGAEWPNKPVRLTHVDGFKWNISDEDSLENRQAYMAYLNKTIALPTTRRGLIDVHSKKGLLTVDFRIGNIRKIKGTTDVAIMANSNIENESFKNNIEILFELKKPPNLDGGKDHTPQAVGEHLAASFLNGDHPVVSVLTDLNNHWTFYWFARRNGDDYKVALYKLCLKGDEAVTEAKYILDSLYDKYDENALLPTTLPNRLSFNDATGKKDSKLAAGGNSFEPYGDDDDNDHTNSSDQNSNRTSEYSSDSIGQGSSSGRSHQAGQAGDNGSSSMNMAHRLSLFAPPSFRDVANKLDLLDMVDENEKYEIVRAFAMQHIVPHIAGG